MDIDRPDISLASIDSSNLSRRGVLGVGAGGVGGIGVLMRWNDSSNEAGPELTDDAAITVHDGPGPATVELTPDNTFDPASLRVDVGTTVVWENDSGTGHSVTAYEDGFPDGAEYFTSGGFDSEETARNEYPSREKIRHKESFEHTFQTAGTYEYFCIPHEDDGMTGTIEVANAGDDEEGSTTDDDTTADDNDTTDGGGGPGAEETPGPGVLTTLGSIGGAGYLLSRLRDDEA